MDERNVDLETIDAALREKNTANYVLRLYVAGMTPQSLKAIETLKRICRAHLPGRHEIEIIDIYQRPERAMEAQLVAAPTLIKELPPPIRKFIGDLSNEERILKGLNIEIKTINRPVSGE